MRFMIASLQRAANRSRMVMISISRPPSAGKLCAARRASDTRRLPAAWPVTWGRFVQQGGSYGARACCVVPRSHQGPNRGDEAGNDRRRAAGGLPAKEVVVLHDADAEKS